MIGRREFVTLLGGAAWSPCLASAQEPAMPVVGFLHIGMADEAQAVPFRKGLSETDYVEGRNVAIDYRWAQNDAAKLAQMAADLVRRRVAVIFAFANVSAAVAKAATSTVPIVFAIGGDPVKMGLVSRLNRPDGNMTGISFSCHGDGREEDGAAARMCAGNNHDGRPRQSDKCRGHG
jgi:putative tryptophan/tyrosine transport system substrate-binding protein